MLSYFKKLSVFSLTDRKKSIKFDKQGNNWDWKFSKFFIQRNYLNILFYFQTESNIIYNPEGT